MDREFTDAFKNTREQFENAFDMIRSIHIGWVEAGDHWVKTLLFLFGERAVGHGNICIGKGVIIKWCIAGQVIGRREITGVIKRPFLLQRYSEKRGPAYLSTHNF